MKELLNNAQLGWGHYHYNGKFVALLFLVLLYFYLRKERERQSLLFLYTAIMTLCCACPVTAALLMCYQTRFYDFQWIMNYVPMTIMIALGATVFLEDCREKISGKTRKDRFRMACVVALLAMLLVVCGRMGQPVVNPQTEEVVFDAGAEKQQQDKVRSVLMELAADVEKADTAEVLCLWAPREVMASVRAQQPNIYPIYGRNMWDAALGAYTYDTYTDAETALYQWMSYAEVYGTLDAVTVEGKVIDGVSCVKSAVAAGVNRILLPSTMQEDVLPILEAALETSAQKLGEYYLFVL